MAPQFFQVWYEPAEDVTYFKEGFKLGYVHVFLSN